MFKKSDQFTSVFSKEFSPYAQKTSQIMGKAGKAVGRFAAISARFAIVEFLDLNKEADRIKLRKMYQAYKTTKLYQMESHPQIKALHAKMIEMEKWEKEDAARSVSSFPLGGIVSALKQKLNTLPPEETWEGNHADLLELAVTIQQGCEERGLVTPLQGLHVSDYVIEVNATETVIDLYTQKLSRVRKDPNLCEEEKTTKIMYLQRLLANQMGRLENA